METALILGATKGLGKALTDLCQQQNWKVIGTGSSVEDGEEQGVIYKHCNLSDPKSVKSLCDYIAHEEIDHFFWVAGRVLKGPFHEQSAEEIANTIDINYRNSMLIAHAAWKRMYNTTTPKSFVVVASSSGRKPRSDEQVYAGTKHALVGTAASLGLENQNENLHVLLVLPGGMQTSFWDRNPTADYGQFLDPQKVAQKIMETMLQQRTAYAELEIPRGSL
jgi:short-subunit dehydrogenase